MNNPASNFVIGGALLLVAVVSFVFLDGPTAVFAGIAGAIGGAIFLIMGAQGPKTPEYPPLDDALSNNPNFDTSFDTNFDTDSWARFDREYGLGDDYPDGPRRNT
ncbi:hypothetical protein EKI51_02585 [Corynebacterium sanguinis]|uniref:hypothetical protein n=1 Tax=Corynebacterium TaxID=1716 RepID=UPI0011A7F968|nr:MULTISPECIES: hypothetical protein [Corynebacterium]MCT1463203.1 hypothetical protein [Corynebacterium sanguinis]MCT2329862.1 hypothetical protein [Corynebacterium sanguinis]TVS25606.1 hypothetical protein EKI51_02585 [Corynebacterium sanguinis]WNI13121.1 hypothetical protein RIU96_01295 [Corynebacterium sp. Z-1]